MKNIFVIFVALVLAGCGKGPGSTDNAGTSKAIAGKSTDSKKVSGKVVPKASPVITVYKSATCGCCVKWVDHLRANGFEVKAVDVEDVNVYKQKAGLPPQLASCHTAFVNGYFIEGHVPANDIRRLLKQKPDIKGLAVPAMPVGSPGMEYKDQKDPYDVISVDRQGKVGVYNSYNKK